MNNVKVEVGELRTKIVYDPGGGGGEGVLPYLIHVGIYRAIG